MRISFYIENDTFFASNTMKTHRGQKSGLEWSLTKQYHLNSWNEVSDFFLQKLIMFWLDIWYTGSNIFIRLSLNKSKDECYIFMTSILYAWFKNELNNIHNHHIFAKIGLHFIIIKMCVHFYHVQATALKCIICIDKMRIEMDQIE